MRAALTTLGAAVLIGPGAPIAAAATSPSPGVHIDPGSPVAKQYAIPLASARGGGSGSAGGLFGRGITRAPSHHARAPQAPPAVTPAIAPTRSAAAAPVVHSAPRSVPARHARHRRHAAAPAATIRPVPAPASAPAATPDPIRAASSGTGLVWMLGAAALVLTLGGLGGAALARYGRRTSPSAS